MHRTVGAKYSLPRVTKFMEQSISWPTTAGMLVVIAVEIKLLVAAQVLRTIYILYIDIFTDIFLPLLYFLLFHIKIKLF